MRLILETEKLKLENYFCIDVVCFLFKIVVLAFSFTVVFVILLGLYV